FGDARDDAQRTVELAVRLGVDGADRAAGDDVVELRTHQDAPRAAQVVDERGARRLRRADRDAPRGELLRAIQRALELRGARLQSVVRRVRAAMVLEIQLAAMLGEIRAGELALEPAVDARPSARVRGHAADRAIGHAAAAVAVADDEQVAALARATQTAVGELAVVPGDDGRDQQRTVFSEPAETRMRPARRVVPLQ